MGKADIARRDGIAGLSRINHRIRDRWVCRNIDGQFLRYAFAPRRPRREGVGRGVGRPDYCRRRRSGGYAAQRYVFGSLNYPRECGSLASRNGAGVRRERSNRI